MILPDYVRFALTRLEERGFEGYAVGGCVRDSLLGKAPLDYDIAVSCSPKETVECFSDCRVIETGIKHGTVTVIIDTHPMELTTFRLDGEYSDNRHPESVSFCANLSEDLSRRDFTVNAMAFSPKNGLVDLFGGEKDLKNGIIRCVGKPEKRFSEDALRIMRCLRFASVLGFEIEADTKRALFECAPLLESISAERLFAELKKLLMGVNAEEVLKTAESIIKLIMPAMQGRSAEEYALGVELAEKSSSLEEKIPLLLCPLGQTSAEETLLKLKADGKQRKITKFLLENRERQFASLGEAKRFTGQWGEQAVLRLISFRELTAPHTSELLKEAISRVQKDNACTKISQLAINGNELAEAGFSGRAVGEVLQRLLTEVTEDRIPNTKEALSEYARLISAEKLNRHT